MGRDPGAGTARLERLLRPTLPDARQQDRVGLEGTPDRPAGTAADFVAEDRGVMDRGVMDRGVMDRGVMDRGVADRVAEHPGATDGGDATRGPRHVAADPSATGPAWRLGGVPTGAAAAAVLVAVVAAFLLLGGGGGPGGGGASDEVVVGPVVQDPTAGAPSPATAPQDAAVVLPRPAPQPQPAQPAQPASGPPAEPASPLVVHVDGAVLSPGVVTVPAGSRVSDAVAAAGGVTADADTRLVNLARPLADGELVVVPVPGEAPVPPAGVAGPGGATVGGEVGGEVGGAVGGEPAPVGPLDLNAADTAALDALPGIGPVLAQRIVAHREQVGPFGSVDDLDAVSGIGPSLMGALRDLVTV